MTHEALCSDGTIGAMSRRCGYLLANGRPCAHPVADPDRPNCGRHAPNRRLVTIEEELDHSPFWTAFALGAQPNIRSAGPLFALEGDIFFDVVGKTSAASDFGNLHDVKLRVAGANDGAPVAASEVIHFHESSFRIVAPQALLDRVPAQRIFDAWAAWQLDE